MSHSFPIPISCAWIFSAGISFAILDSNNNDLSDFWEKEHNAGQLFPANFDSQADDDNDGWTNVQEAAAGTDPFDPNPPDGLIRPATCHIPAVMGEENGLPVVITPEAVTVTWPTLTGKQYTLQFSSDLSAGSWVPVGSPFIASGGVSSYEFYELSAADKCFWRVAVNDVDSDGDGLTDHEESQTGSNSSTSDTDGDGLTDKEEAEIGTNPNNRNTDGDKLDGEDLNDGEDAVPLDAEINWRKTPENRYVWIEQMTVPTDANDVPVPPVATNSRGQILFAGYTAGQYDSTTDPTKDALWDSAARQWTNLPLSGSQTIQADTDLSITVTDEAGGFIDINDAGTVSALGRGSASAYTSTVGAHVINRTQPAMIWENTGGTSPTYGQPKYYLYHPAHPKHPDPPNPEDTSYRDTCWSELDFWVHYGSLFHWDSWKAPGGRLGIDGSTNLCAHISGSNYFQGPDWILRDGTSASAMLDRIIRQLPSVPGYYTFPGAVLDKDRALFVETPDGETTASLWLKDGGILETIATITTPIEFHETDIIRAPTETDDDTERLWIAAGDEILLEKRDGGTGAARWHQPPTMGEGAHRLNARGEAIIRGRSTVTPPLLPVPPKLWRNGKYISLDDDELVSKPSTVEIKEAIDLASNGIILAQADDGGVMKTGLLLPVDIEFVFGFGPLTHLNDLQRKDLETKLSEMNPVYQDIKPGKSVFVIKGNPQGNMDADAKDTKLWTIQLSSSAEALKSALSSTPYVVFTGHSNMGLGPAFNPAGIGTTSDFFNIGNPQTAINFPYLKIDYTNLNVTDAEIPDSSNNYWVLPDIIGVGSVNGGIQRFQNDEGILPPNAISFHPRSGKPRNQGWHFKRDPGHEENIIVNIPAGASAADLPKLGYKTFFNNACNTVRDYSEVFSAHKGSIFIGSNKTTNAALGEIDDLDIDQSNFFFAQKLMAGESWQAILSAIDAAQADLNVSDAYRLINF